MTICWWSGGITSAVACKKAIEIFGEDRCRVVFIDTKNEDDDTYRFKDDCAGWYEKEIETISGIPEVYKSIEEVWRRHKSLNVASGAVCSYMLKRRVREKWEKENQFDFQVFGFEFDKKEFNRARSMVTNHSKAKPIFPLLMLGLTKEDCLRIVEDAGLEIPRAYRLGFNNNNCLRTGCIQGGSGYWAKMKRDFPEKFEKMSLIEHELTNLKGKPVTMLKDQSKSAKESGNELVFLKKHPDYPDLKTIDDIKGREPKPLAECNGFCGLNDLNERNETMDEINWDDAEQISFF